MISSLYKTKKILIVFLFLSLLLFVRSLFFDWFIFDDDLHIFGNNDMKLESFRDLTHFWFERSSKIPLSFNFWQLITSISSTKFAWSFRFFNILFHALNAYLVFLYLIKISDFFFKERKEIVLGSSLVASCFFLSHPAQLESVIWVSSFKGILSTTFSLFSLIYYLKSEDSKRNHFQKIFLPTLFLILAVLAKPSAVILPALFILVDIVIFKKELKDVLHKNGHLLLLGLVVVILQITEFSSYLVNSETDLWSKVSLAGLTFKTYLKISLFPIELNFDYQQNIDYLKWALKKNVFDIRLSLLLSFSYIWLAIYCIFKQSTRVYGLSLLFFLISISVNLGLVTYDFQRISTAADRYLYFPLIGFSMLIHFLILELSEKEYLRRVPFVFFSFVIGLNIILSQKRLNEWSDSATLLGSHNQKMSKAVAQALIGSYIGTGETLKAFNLFVEKNSLLGEESAHFLKAILEELGRKKYIEEGEALINLSIVNEIDLSSKSIIDFYIKAGLFFEASQKIKEHYSEINLVDIHRFRYLMNINKEEKIFSSYITATQYFIDQGDVKRASRHFKKSFDWKGGVKGGERFIYRLKKRIDILKREKIRKGDSNEFYEKLRKGEVN